MMSGTLVVISVKV